jgi:hypothetical protein
MPKGLECFQTWAGVFKSDSLVSAIEVHNIWIVVFSSLETLEPFFWHFWTAVGAVHPPQKMCFKP